MNLYLHGFTDPHIFEYDTLTSEERWNEFADVILANPPFMSPKGGIKPHKRFSIQAKRSEVLFVDYMAEHLTPNGRAAIIVPEGIIFQSQGAYKELRRMLVENSLVAVVSLPAGVFQPYSGVKTSILLLDKSLAKAADTIAFFKVENDGFGLGAQRRAIEKNDLPQVLAGLKEFIHMDRQDKQDENKKSCKSYSSMLNALIESGKALIVPKERIAANGDYNLSGERYREGAAVSASFPLVLLGDVCDVSKGSPITRDEVVKGTVPVIAGGQQPSCYHNAANRTGETITVSASGAYAGFVAYFDQPIFASDCSTIQPRDHRILSRFLFRLLKSKQADIYAMQVGMGQPHVYSKDLVKIQIPLPPLEVQQEIVAEIEGYQKVINGARAVLDHYRPHIPIHPDWPMVEFGSVIDVLTDFTANGSFASLKDNVTYRRTRAFALLVRLTDLRLNLQNDEQVFVSEESYRFLKKSSLHGGEFLLANVGANIGDAYLMPFINQPATLGPNMFLLKFTSEVLPDYVFGLNKSGLLKDKVVELSQSAAQPKINKSELRSITIPLPPLATQQAIVAEIEAEQALVAANRELITRFEQKIQATLARVWGEAAPEPNSRLEA